MVSLLLSLCTIPGGRTGGREGREGVLDMLDEFDYRGDSSSDVELSLFLKVS